MTGPRILTDEERSEIRAMNARAWGRVNSASPEPPSLLCEDCGQRDDCLCNDLDQNQKIGPIGETKCNYPSRST